MGNKQEKSLIIANRYRIIEELGKGSMGIVYKVQDTFRSNEFKALKMVRKEIINLDVIENFKKEFEIMRKLRHPNLILVYDFGYENSRDFYYLTMEYVNGKTLKELSKQKLKEKKVLNIIVSLCRTLEFIHSRNILHRDIKPSNILIKGNKMKIVDFGLSDLGNEEYKPKGSLLYTAPENLESKADNRADIFSLGLVFYELITGKNFYNDKSTSAIADILRNEDKFTNYKNNTVQTIENPNIREIISIMLDFFPENRFQHCSEIIYSINKNLKRRYSIETTKTRESYVLGAGFVGRKEELIKLKEHLKAENNNKILLVKGKAGIGKSRLFQEFRKYCQLQNIEFLEANCRENIAKIFAPFIDILNDILCNASQEIIKKYGPELKKILPVHKVFSEIKINSAQEPKTEHGIIVQSITNFLLEYSKQQSSKKVVICLNDIHWADEASLEVLQELMYKISITENEKDSTVNLFVFSSVREEEIDKIEKILSKLRNKKRLKEIELHPFDADDVSNYIEAIFGVYYLSDSLKKEIPEIGKKVGGNPFFLQQLMKSLVERGIINRKILKWELLKPIKEIKVPSNLKEIIKKSIENLKLSNNEKKTLQYFALLNKPINTEELKQILPSEIDINLKDFFVNLESKELLISEKQQQAEKANSLFSTCPVGKNDSIGDSYFLSPLYSFTHSLIREVIEEELTDKQEFHHHIAQRIEEIYQNNLEEYIDELATHYNQTNDKEKAIHYLEKAGDKAIANYANEKAISYYDKLILLIPADNKKKKIEIMLKKGNILEIIGKWDEAINFYQNSLNLSEEINDKLLIGENKNRLGILLFKKGNYKKAFRLLKEAQQIFKNLDDKKGFSKVLYNLGIIYLNQGNYEKAMECYKRSLEINEKFGYRESIGNILNSTGNIYLVKGNYEKAMEYYKRSLEINKELGRKRGLSLLLSNIGIIYQERGNYEKAMEYYKRSLEINKELGRKQMISLIFGNIGVIYQKRENYKKAIEYHRKSLSIQEELGNKKGISIAFGNIGIIYSKLGNYKKAMGYLKIFLKISKELNERRNICIALGNIGNLYKLMKKYYKAEEYFNRSILLGRELQLKYFLLMSIYNEANLYYIQKRYDEANKLNEEAQNIAEEINCKYFQFYASILSLKIKFSKEKKYQNKLSALKRLEDMLSNVKDDKKQIAILNYELWKMKKKLVVSGEKIGVRKDELEILKKEKYREKALKLYQELYKKSPQIEYKERIEEMEKDVRNEKNITQTSLFEKKQTSEFIYSAKYVSEFINIVLKLNNLNLSELYREIVDLSIRFIDAERGFLLLYNEQGELQVEVARDKDGKELEIRNKKLIINNEEKYKQKALKENEEMGKEKVTQTIFFQKNLTPKPQYISQTVINRVIKTGKPLFVPNIAEFEEIDKTQSVIDLKLKSVMCVMLGRKSDHSANNERRKYFPTRSTFLGLLYVDSTKTTEKNKFKGENLHLLQAIASQASYSLINALFYEKTNIDALTGLYLRPYFDNRLNSEIQFHRTHNSIFCLLMIDIDLFKNINDSFGHQKGDEVLQKLGDIFKNRFRASDICARYGGDEFVVLLANTNKKQAEIVAKELLHIVNSTDFSGIQITLSIGISEFNKNTKYLQQVLKQADEALYAAKNAGRNCYKIWDKSYSNLKQSYITDILTGDPIRDYRNVEMLLQSIKASISVLNYKDLLDKIVETILEITNSERCLLILQNDKENWELKLAKNNKGEFLSGKINYSKTLVNEVIKNRIPYCLKDIKEDKATKSQIYLNLRSAMCVPLQIKEKLLGVIYVDSQYALQQFSQPELSIFSAVASQLALIIENTRLHEIAIKAGKLKERLLQEEIIYLHKKLKGKTMILGKSKAMEIVFSKIRKVAKTDSTVLIYGETGTGKELIARAIHNASFRHDKPFIIADCGAISSELIEGELFGYEKGSYTGAYKQKKGLLEVANGGTIFLDEIGELPLHLQPKLLRFLQERNIRRLGGTKRIKVNVRIIIATNKNLEKLVSEGKFREDLFYRLNVFPIKLPPLREREDDVLILANYFLKLYGRTRNIKGFTDEAIELLKTYQWPGNVRELQHKIERAVILSESDYISVQDLEIGKQEKNIKKEKKSEDNIFILTKDELLMNSGKTGILEEIKKRVINFALENAKGDLSKAAKFLGIHRTTLYRMLKRDK